MQPNTCYINSDNCLVGFNRGVNRKMAPIEEWFDHQAMKHLAQDAKVKDELRVVIDEFFKMMDLVPWKYHMLDWLDAQLKLFGFSYNSACLVPAHAKDLVNALLNGLEVEAPFIVGDREIGRLKETAESVRRRADELLKR